MMKAFYSVTLLVLIIAACATVDVEDKAWSASAGKVEGPALLTVPVDYGPPEVTIIEKPVYVPQDTPREAARPPEKPRGKAAVQESNDKGIIPPSEYSYAAMVYDYNPDWVYEVYTQPLRASDLSLEPGEHVLTDEGSVFVSDSDRFILGSGANLEAGRAIQHIYVKPVEAGLAATLIINTDRRVYHIILKSFKDQHMPKVRWRYPSAGNLPWHLVTPPKNEAAEGESPLPSIDPRYLSFNYKITYTLFRKPSWLPELVYDDGKKTYLTFPRDVLQKQQPVILENRADVVNYRVSENLVIIDKLIEELNVKLDEREIMIVKKPGK